jgi:hypothetical protein
MCGKFGLLSHLAVVSPPPTDDAWVQADFCIRSWIFGTVSDSVLNLAMTSDQQTAGQLWTAITDLYQANKAPRAIFLSHEFHSMTQGDSSIDAYCLRMKEAAANLRDVGQTITKPNLILNLLRGLNEKYQSVADNIAAQEPHICCCPEPTPPQGAASHERGQGPRRFSPRCLQQRPWWRPTGRRPAAAAAARQRRPPRQHSARQQAPALGF